MILSAGLVWTVVLLVLISLWLLLLKRRRVANMIDKLPGPKSYPILGFVYNLIGLSAEDRLTFMLGVTKNYFCDGVVRVWLGPKPLVLLFKPDYIEALLSSQVHLQKSMLYNFLNSWLGLGLLTSTGAKWHSRRKLLTPAFHFGILEEFLHIFNEQSNILVTKMDENKDCDLYKLITLCSLDIICATAMGRNICAQLNQDSKYVAAVSEATEEIYERFLSPWYYPDFIYNLSIRGRRFRNNVKILKSFTRKVIDAKQEELRERKVDKQNVDSEEVAGGKRKLAFLDMLLQYSDNGRVLSDDDIQEEVDTFMFEGHDTTAAGIYWALYHLGSNPHIQEKLHKHLDSIFENSDRHVQLDDLSKMKYLEMVCKEALRMTPSVPIIARQLQQDLKIGEYVIPAGVECGVSPILTHRLEDHFPDPFKFDPDRFLSTNSKGRHPYAYIPFSAGPRNCIGQKFALMEEKVVLANILRNYEVTTESIPQYPEGAYFNPTVTCKPSSKCKIRIRRRNI